MNYRKTLLVVFVALLALTACDGDNGGNAMAPPTSPQMDIRDSLVSRVDPILNKNIAGPDDMRVLSSLTDEELGLIFAYYEKHPKFPVDEQDINQDGTLAPDLAQESWVEEPIEFTGWGYGGWVAYSWLHTSLCGGDPADHFFFYPNVPNGYTDRGRLRFRTMHPGIYLVMQRYGRRLSSRVYPDGDVFTCVGVSLHVVGVSHEAWRTGTYLYKM